MQPKITCFWLEDTGKVLRQFRRYRSSADKNSPCRGRYGYHNGHAPFDVVQGEPNRVISGGAMPKTDPRWPTKCDACDYIFQPDDAWQISPTSIYRRTDTGEEMTLRDAPFGAMWDAWWFDEHRKGPDGLHLMIKTPAGEWSVDGPAAFGSNSREPWKRAGDPRTPGSVSAQPSILFNGPPCFHAWLTNGELHVLPDSAPF